MIDRAEGRRIIKRMQSICFGPGDADAESMLRDLESAVHAELAALQPAKADSADDDEEPKQRKRRGGYDRQVI